MSARKIIYILLLSVIIISPLFSEPVVKAIINSREYYRGDIVRVLVVVEENPGIHGLFFDLEYDEEVLAFEGVRDGNISRGTGDTADLVYAVSGETTRRNLGAHVVVGYSLKEKEAVTSDNGALVELSFRVHNAGDPEKYYSFKFYSCGLRDTDNEDILGVTWQDSASFRILETIPTEFIFIKRPYDNQVFYNDEARVSLICSEGDYFVSLENDSDQNATIENIPVTGGSLIGEVMSLQTGFNIITAKLFQNNPGGQPIDKVEDKVKVYCADESEFVSIITPADHALLNTDMVDVRVTSSFPTVEVNGVTARDTGTLMNNTPVYHARVWLRQGFNSITAVAKKDFGSTVLYRGDTSDWIGATWLTDYSADWEPNVFVGKYLEVEGMFARVTDNTQTTINFSDSDITITGAGYAYSVKEEMVSDGIIESGPVTYSDSITVYYQKDSSIFNFILPEAGRVFKPSSYTKLYIKGEIDSPYKTSDDPEAGGPVENTVTLSVLYDPLNPLEGSRYLVHDKQAKIVDNDYSYGTAGSKYIFYNDFDIVLNNLEDGELHIIAYKNKEGTMYDDAISRIVHIDNKRLWIDLVQPNVYTSDVLDTKQKLSTFNENIPLDESGNMTMNIEGKLGLVATDPVIEDIELGNVKEMIEAPDGTLYALGNTQNGLLKIYIKELGSTGWSEYIVRSGVYGYSFCFTDLGILVGASNLFSTNNSGLYLLSGNNFLNISLPENLSHIQFVKNKGETIYLYGNNYQYLYSFSINSIEEEGGGLNVTHLNRIPFFNFYNIKDFILTGDARVAMLRTDESENNIHFYKKIASGYVPVTLPELGDDEILTGDNVILGEYTSGEYNSFLIPKNAGMLEVLMYNKSDGKIVRNEVNISTLLQEDTIFDSLLGIGFYNDAFFFAYTTINQEYKVKNGKVFFTHFYPAFSDNENLYVNPSITVTQRNTKLFITKNGDIFCGIDGQDNHLITMYKKLEETGTVQFNYVNDDIDGLTGFQFDVEPLWLKKEGSILFGFEVRQKVGDTTNASLDDVVFTLVKIDLFTLSQGIAESSLDCYQTDYFTITSRYDAFTGLKTINCVFHELAISKYIQFDITINSFGSTSPFISNIEIFKKVKAKMAKPEDNLITIPIRGYVYDRTVTKVEIQHIDVLLGRDGSFFYNYIIRTRDEIIPIEITCTNGAGERAELTFTVELVESINDIWDVQYQLTPGPGEDYFSLNDISTDSETMWLRGKYYGLRGCIVGYEIHGYDPSQDIYTLLKRGMFEIVEDTDIEVDINLSPEYEIGHFDEQEILLVPGEQQLVIYCENPGGLRTEYTIGGAYPSIIYNMPDDKQGIIFDIFETADTEILGIPITNRLILDALEGPPPNYIFSKEYLVSGQINSLYIFDDIIIKDLSDYNQHTGRLVFENGEHEITVPVEAGGQFQFSFRVIMGQGRDELNQTFYCAAIPSLPVMNHLKRGIEIVVKKNFKDTDFRATFPDMDPEEWSDTEKDEGKVPFKFRFNRDDLPLNGHTSGEFRFNYMYDFEGFVDIYEGPIYCLKNPDTEEIISLDLSYVHEGKNRIQWRFEYKDPLDNNQYTISTSYSEKMPDYIFEYYPEASAMKTMIGFEPGLTDAYYNNEEIPLPTLIITKDKLTRCEFSCNGFEINGDWVEMGNTHTLSLPLSSIDPSIIVEGKNQLSVGYEEPGRSPVTRTYTFLYDTLAPAVQIASYEIFLNDKEVNYLQLHSISAGVIEANFKKAYLYYAGNIINADPEIIIKGTDRYQIIWYDLDEHIIIPSEVRPVKVEVIDHAGKHTFSSEFYGVNPIERPVESAAGKIGLINSRYYNMDEAPVYLENEENYTGRLFPRHYKFAPRYYLKKVNIKQALIDKEYILIKNDIGDDPFNTNLLEEYYYRGFNEGKWGEYGKFLVVKIAKDPNIPVMQIDHVEGKIKFNIQGTKDGGESFGPQQIIFDEGEYTWVEGHDYVYYIVQLYEDDDVIEDDETGLKIKFIDTLTNLVQGAIPTSSELEIKIDLGTDFRPAGVFLTGDDTTDMKDLCMYDPNYEDHEHYRVSVEDIIADNRKSLINNEKEAIDSLVRRFEPESNSEFGKAIVLRDNYALIGAPGETVEGIDGAGAVYLFEKNSSGLWEEEEVIRFTAPEGECGAFDHFGCSVALHDDFAFIGAYGKDINGMVNTGTVYVFKKDETHGWNAAYYLNMLEPTITAFSCFGNAIDVSRDYVIVGAHGENRFKGATYIYQYDSDADEWNFHEKLTLDEEGTGFWFGRSVAIDGDVAAVGAPGKESGKGAVYIYNRNGTEWNGPDIILADDGCTGDEFGNAVDISSGMIAIGAHFDDGDDNNEEKTGSVYIYTYNEYYWDEKLISQKPASSNHYSETFEDNPRDYDYFGTAVAMTANDDLKRLLVGASGDDYRPGSERTETGAVYLYEYSGLSWGLKRKLYNRACTEYSELGSDLALSGTEALLGAYRYDEDESSANTGSVFVIDKSQWYREVHGDEMVIRKEESTDPNVIYDEKSEQVLPVNLLEYLIFKIQKSELDDITDIKSINGSEGEIVFEFTANGYDIHNSSFIDFEQPIPVPEGLDWYEYRENYLIYGVKMWQWRDGERIVWLEKEFKDLIEAKNNQFPEHWTYYEVTDRGSLRINYIGNLEGYNGIELYTSVHGRYDVGNEQVGDFSYDFYDDIAGIDDCSDLTYRHDDHYRIHPYFDYTIDERSLKRRGSSDQMTINFWLRIEDEGQDQGNPVFHNNFRRVLTLCDAGGEEKIMMGYKGFEGEQTTFFYFYEIKDGKKFDFPELDKNKFGPINPEIKIRKNDWYLVSLEFNKSDYAFRFFIDGQMMSTGTFNDRTAEMDQVTMEMLMAEGSRYYFGCREGDEGDYNTGFFSIADPYFIDRVFTQEELTRMMNLKGRVIPSQLVFRFPNPTASFSEGEYDNSTMLNSIGGTDYFSYNNADYTEYNPEINYGSLKASSVHKNLFKQKEDEFWIPVLGSIENSCLAYELDIFPGISFDSTLDVNVSASSSVSGFRPENTIGYFEESWKTTGIDEYITYEFENKRLINSIGIAFGHEYRQKFTVKYSLDGEDWQILLEEKESAGQLGTPGNYEIFDFPFVSAQYLKIINKRNNSTDTAIKNDISIFQVNFGITVLSEGGNGFALIPRGEKPGHYFFGNKNGNYGLEQDRWFSVSGYVVSIEEGKKADLVMRVNSEEQRMTLQEGPFHFIYDNASEMIPAEVKLFIETNGLIVFKNDMQCNAGNFIIKEDMDRTAASTFFPFDLSGTVHFWYKPFITNKDGYVNYPLDLSGQTKRDITIFDSEYIKIGATVPDRSDDAVFYAAIKSSSTGYIEQKHKLMSHTKLTHAWHHLQVSYDVVSGIAYFYIDGKMAAAIEKTGILDNDLPAFGSITGEKIPEHDNVWIGCSMEQDAFAEGYIDSIEINNKYMPPQYTKNNPVNIYYDKENLTIKMENIQGGMITGFTALLESLDTNKRWIHDIFGDISLATLPGGRYRLTCSMNVNGHHYGEILTFNCTEKPRFILKNHTPVIFQNQLIDVKYSFAFDHAYRLGNKDLVYAGAAVKILYENASSSESLSKTIYIVQNFQTQNPGEWIWGYDTDGRITWNPVAPTNDGLLPIVFEDIQSTGNILTTIKYFYFIDSFSSAERFTDDEQADEDITIPIAALDDIVTLPDSFGYDYKLILKVSGYTGTDSGEFYNDIEFAYTVTNDETGKVSTGSVMSDENGQAELYFDNILPDYGSYHFDVSLLYKGTVYATKSGVQITWDQYYEETPILQATTLEIEDFSLLHLDKERDSVNLYLKYYCENVKPINYTLSVKQANKIYGIPEEGTLEASPNTMLFQNIGIPKNKSTVRITLKTESIEDTGVVFIRTEEIEVNNSISAPEVVFTNSVDSLISYNDVFFSWKGYYEGVFREDIAYSYIFDNSVWSTPSNEWRSIRFYDIDEGYHSFAVKAHYNNMESAVISVSFFVDVNKPTFHDERIHINRVYDDDGVFHAITITGDDGAIDDISLREVYVNGSKVTLGENGSFEARRIPITVDGMMDFTITAVDRVGNYTDHVVHVQNPITRIIFPDITYTVQYSPLTVVGSINESIQSDLSIYLRDPFCTDSTTGEFEGWKKATINPDRTFFVENVFVNPGTVNKEIVTTLTVKTVFASGKEFTRKLVVKANEIIMPIEMKLSTHAAEGENSDTFVEINCRANVQDISSWSIDFDGDGVYDVIDMTDNPSSPESLFHVWTHKYSSLGLVNPRVRIITMDGNFFSVSDTIIIHEKIKEASNKIIDSPLSLDVIRMPDKSERIFVLRQKGENEIIEVFEVGRNETYINKKLFEIDLEQYGIRKANVLRLLGSNHIFIAMNDEEQVDPYRIYELTANEFGNYIVEGKVRLNNKIEDMCIDDQKLFVSFTDQNYLAEIDVKDETLDTESVTYVTPQVTNSFGMSSKTGLAIDKMGILLADYYNQRIIRMSQSLKIVEQFGTIGTGEKEFVKPAIIKSFENRLFVYDEGRQDIQVFDANYRPVCTLEYSLNPEYYNYFTTTFLNDIADMDIIAKEEGNRLYYYVLLLSRSDNTLAMLRLPQWEELRARVRNNKVVFIKDGEVYTAKPNGSDVMKILSTDSLPRIEGQLDYPALAPDGRSLVFTSRKRLYNGEAYGYITDGNEHAYDNLYLIDIETKELKLLDLGEVNNYELERPVFNYNGDKLIFSAKPTGGNWQIFVYDIKEKSIDWLFRSDEDARFPYYSPDDRFVVFTTTYDGDEDISIIDTKNPNVRVYVTDNMCRDSFPVWSRIYPLEINTNDEILKDVTSKIAFVSERDRPKGVHIVYLKRMSEDDIQVFDLYQKQISGEDPDEASIEITNSDVEGDYPCFTGDGRSLLFEHFKGGINRIKRFDFAGIDPDDMGENGDINKQEMLKDNPQFIFEDIEILEGSLRPAGMKNTITNFAAANQNGNEITLTWDRYTSQNIFYTVQFKAKSESAEAGEKKIFDQQQAVITGLKLGYTYLVRVCIEENRVVVATSQWQEVKMPHVVARPMYEIDEENPYGVHLKGWKPDVDDTWKFTWFIENKKIEMGTTDEFYYHFATSGTKTICLQVTDSTGNHSDMSDPMEVIIISDIVPVIEYVLADDSSYIDLDATKSRGENINEAATVWIISGPGRDEIQVTGSKNTAQLNGFQYKVNITLRLSRLPVEGQSAADTREKSIVVDLDFKELKPIITYQVNPLDERLIKFSGEQSLGNIDWYRAEWTIFADNAVICDRKGVSTFEYLFPERTKTTTYTITLTIPRRNDGMTETVSQIIDVEAKPLEPVIGYEILTMKKAGDTVGYKVLFDCSKSRGNDIDFTLSRWSVPGVDIYGEQSVQFGPTAIYNLLGIESGIVIEVALTLFRTGGKDPVTITKFIPLRTGEFPEAKLIVNETIEESSEGKVLVLDVLKSTGPNINWERTEWFVDGQSLPRRGPVVRYDIPAVDTDQVINYTCTFYRYGQDPEIYHGAVTIGKATITPIISWKTFGSQKNLIEMDVFESDGVNIDWDRSAWYIYDGNETVVQKQGAKIAHAFALTEENMGYPVMVNMYFKGGSFPFVGYKNIDVEGDELIPVFDIEQSSEDSLIFIFSAENSSGSNIDWTQTKWTFLDTSESLYGPVVAHKFPADDVDRTYMVRLTLVRKSSTGIVETKSLTQEIDITKDEIIPAVTAKLYDDYLVLSAEGSTGKGLLLDRSVWMFPGEGDTGSYSAHYEGGVINRGNINLSAEAYLRSNTNIYSQAQVGTEIDIGFFGGHLHLGGENGCFFKAGVRNDIDIGASLQTGGAYTTEVVDYSNYTNENKSFSASNMHTGAVCRRYAGDVNNVIVTLFIFRMNKDGGMTGKSITVKIDLKKVKTEPETYK